MKKMEEITQALHDKLAIQDAIKKEYKDKNKSKALTDKERIERIEKLLGLL